MRSRAELRAAGEWGLRAVLIALLALALWRTLHARARGGETRRIASGALARALGDATRGAGVRAIDVELDALPTPVQRAWLGALRGAGLTVRWHGPVPALALSAERVREPDAAVRLLLAADNGAAVAIGDAVGALDTLRVRAGGATLDAPEVVGHVRAQQGSYVASVVPPRPAARREVLVLARAGWESRFVLAALGEAGWHLRARLVAAPGIAVTDAGLLPIDTARYDVVVALDSSAADLAPAIARFVGAGGGLVAAGGATSLGPLRAIVPARAGTRRPGRILLDADSMTRAGLPLRALAALRPDAVLLERQPAGIAVAVRRAGAGRVLAVGYDESWRWRMLGGASGPSAHRAWWSRTVGLVAPEREVADSGVPAGDAAPRASLVASLGPSGVAMEVSTGTGDDTLPLVLLVLIAVALLAETASRRFRGAR